MLFICYPKCSTCQKARKWLDEHNIQYTERHIVEENPSYEELKQWHEKSGLPLKRFFNTSGMIYRKMDLKKQTAGDGTGRAVKAACYRRYACETAAGCDRGPCACRI